MQNLGRFYTASNFDCEYLGNESSLDIQKSDRHLTENDSSHIWWKESGELWSTVQKVGHVRLDPAKLTFSGDCFSPQAPQIITHTRDSPRLTNTPHKWGLVPPKF